MMTIDIKFACEGCGQRLVVEAEAAGLSTSCPSCACDLMVPRPLPHSGRAGGLHLAGPVARAQAEEDEEGNDDNILRRELAGAHLLIERSEEQRRKENAELARLKGLYEVQRRDLAALHETLARQEEGSAQERKLAGETLHRWQAACAAAEQGQQAAAETLARREEEASATAKAREIAENLAATLRAELTAREHEITAQRDRLESLSEGLRQTEGRLSAAERDLAAAQVVAAEKARLEGELAQAAARWQQAEAASASLAQTCEQMHRETEALKLQLSESAAGREVLSLRTASEVAMAEIARLGRVLGETESELRRCQEEEQRHRVTVESLRTRCVKAEQHAERQEDSTLVRDRDVLRGIVERQKVEIERQHVALNRLRRGKIALRLAYALTGIVTIAAIAMLAHLAQNLIAGLPAF